MGLAYFIVTITKTYLYNFDALKPLFYTVKLGLTGYALFFLFLLKNIDRNMKDIGILSENIQFLVVKCSIYLNRRVLNRHFGHLHQLPILLSVLLVVVKSAIGTQDEVG